MQQTFAVLEKGKTMTDYIKREDAIYCVKSMLNAISAEDVAPVRHGRWMDMKGFWMCSECHKDTLNLFKYCPYCGAKNAGEVE